MSIKQEVRVNPKTNFFKQKESKGFLNTKQINEKGKNSKSILKHRVLLFFICLMAKNPGRDLVDSRPRMCKVSAENV